VWVVKLKQDVYGCCNCFCLSDPRNLLYIFQTMIIFIHHICNTLFYNFSQQQPCVNSGKGLVEEETMLELYSNPLSDISELELNNIKIVASNVSTSSLCKTSQSHCLMYGSDGELSSNDRHKSQ